MAYRGEKENPISCELRVKEGDDNNDNKSSVCERFHGGDECV